MGEEREGAIGVEGVNELPARPGVNFLFPCLSFRPRTGEGVEGD